VVENAHAPTLHHDFQQIDASASVRASCGVPGEVPCRVSKSLQGVAPQAVAGPVARAQLPRLHLDTHQRVLDPEDQVDLSVDRAQPAREQTPAATAEVALGQPLAQASQLGRRRTPEPEEQPWKQERRPEAERPQALAASGFSAFSDFSSVMMVWIAARLKRMRTPSDTWSTTTSSWICATLP